MSDNLSYYKVFLDVAKTGNISNTAKNLYISQPAVSKAINRLEENLETRLFERKARGVQLTYEGQLLYQKVLEGFHCIDTGEEQLRQSLRMGMGKLSIGVSSTLCKYVLLPYLKEYTRQYPHIELSIRCQSTFQTIKDLEDGTIDFGLIGKPEFHTTLEFIPIQTIHDIFVCTKTYYTNLCFRCPDIINQPLHDATIMLLNKNNLTRKYVESFLSDLIDQNHILETTSMDLLIEFAQIDIGIACVIREFVSRQLQEGQLMEVPIADKIPNREIGLAFSSKANPTSAMTYFIHFIRNINY